MADTVVVLCDNDDRTYTDNFYGSPNVVSQCGQWHTVFITRTTLCFCAVDLVKKAHPTFKNLQ